MVLFHIHNKKTSLYDRFAVEELKNKRNLRWNKLIHFDESLQIIILDLIIY